VQFADIDCRWSPTHQTRGAADRLRHAADRYGLVGFTFYLEENADPAWILSPDGLAFFAAAAERDQIVSLACGPHQLATIAKLAQRFPAMPFLLHHLARVRADDPAHLPLLLAVARVPNLFVKISGFPHATPRGWDFPCRDVLPIARAIYEHFGPSRMCWGSDYPVIRRALTYRQGIEIVRTHCDFIARDDLPTILGGTLAGLLDSRA
jgi:predicted TIM-barrel fold metal-dependent hydrolase